jgi:hypothetical protein
VAAATAAARQRDCVTSAAAWWRRGGGGSGGGGGGGCAAAVHSATAAVDGRGEGKGDRRCDGDATATECAMVIDGDGRPVVFDDIETEDKEIAHEYDEGAGVTIIRQSLSFCISIFLGDLACRTSFRMKFTFSLCFGDSPSMKAFRSTFFTSTSKVQSQLIVVNRCHAPQVRWRNPIFCQPGQGPLPQGGTQSPLVS